MSKLATIIITSLSLVTLFQCASCSEVVWAQSKQRPQPLTVEQKQQELHDILSRIPNVHMATQIPVNFPIPAYPNNVVRTNFSNSTKGTPTAAAMIVTRDHPKDVFQWYVDACTRSAWSVKIPTPQAMSLMTKKQQFMMLNAKKDNQEIALFCMPDSKTSGTLVNISWCKRTR
ncbi:MAG TPA: hypothetical protein V6C69_07025 [Trichormus sp.]|jgi:hypothetical protein